MQQRQYRPGDVLDDYCPRERRVTNHAVVAMVAEDVKQTRCTTCDAEHVYKGGKAPRRKKTETTGKLYKQVLAGLTDSETAASSAEADTMDQPEHDQAPDPIDAVADAADTPLVDGPAERVPGLDVADAGEQVPADVAAGMGAGHDTVGVAVGGERDGGNVQPARLGDRGGWWRADGLGQ